MGGGSRYPLRVGQDPHWQVGGSGPVHLHIKPWGWGGPPTGGGRGPVGRPGSPPGRSLGRRGPQDRPGWGFGEVRRRQAGELAPCGGLCGPQLPTPSSQWPGDGWFSVGSKKRAHRKKGGRHPTMAPGGAHKQLFPAEVEETWSGNFGPCQKRGRQQGNLGHLPKKKQKHAPPENA